MKEGQRKNIIIPVWISVFLLYWQVVSSFEVIYLNARKGEIKTPSYPQKYNYRMDQNREWQIRAPRGYRIRLIFKDFDVGGDCKTSFKGDHLEVFNGMEWFLLCGQKLPATIESTKRDMELYLSVTSETTGGKFWASYEMFDRNELKSTQRSTILQNTTTRNLYTGDPDLGGNSSGTTGSQRLFLLVSIMGCVIILFFVAIFCGCRRERRRPSSRIPANVRYNNNTTPESNDEFLELNFGDPPPSYEEVTRQSNPDISGSNSTQQAAAESTTTEIEVTDSSGLPSYAEALRLSEQSLNAQV